jgi:hypothetical protein
MSTPVKTLYEGQESRVAMLRARECGFVPAAARNIDCCGRCQWIQIHGRGDNSRCILHRLAVMKMGICNDFRAPEDTELRPKTNGTIRSSTANP